MARIKANNIGLLSLSSTILSCGVGLAGSYAFSRWGFQVDYGLNITLSWLALHAPLASAVVSAIKRELGERSPVTVTGASALQNRRAIPMNANGRASQLFMSVMPQSPQLQAHNRNASAIANDSVERFIVENNGIGYTVQLPELEDFLSVAWRRQMSGKHAFARTYWTRTRRPKLNRQQYEALMNVLLPVDGLVLDRSAKRSGRLALPPKLAILAIQGRFGPD